MSKPLFHLLLVVSLVAGFFTIDASAGIPTYDRVRIIATPRLISDAELTDQHGRSFRLSALSGKAAMIFFGFTNCPDVCPIAMQKLKQFKSTGENDVDDVSIVMISVDGDRDTPEQLDEFVSRYSDDFLGLTGEPTVVKKIAGEFSAAFFKESSSTHDRNYTVSHSPQVFLIDKEGRLRAEFYNATVEAMIGVTLAVDRESTSRE